MPSSPSTRRPAAAVTGATVLLLLVVGCSGAGSPAPSAAPPATRTPASVSAGGSDAADARTTTPPVTTPTAAGVTTATPGSATTPASPTPAAVTSGPAGPATDPAAVTATGSVPPPAPPADDAPSTDDTRTSGFRATVSPVDDTLAARMARSWRPGCPVPLTALRHLTLSYRAPDGSDRTGELVVAATVADDVVSVFHQLYDDGFPITSMRLVDDFDADDDASMAADNTSAFNCRPVTGGTGFSEHAYGTAVDVNPRQNPYVRGATVLPPAGADFVDRPDTPGVIHPGDATVAAFAAIGWSWGGDWTTPTDYQHFSLSGR